MEMWNDIWNIVLLPILGILTAFLVQYINVKKEELKAKTKNETYNKYMDLLSNTITNCVLATQQTYVDSLKKQGKFDMEAQKVAFNMTFTAVLGILSEEAKVYLNEALGDLNQYITQNIEAEVIINKK